MAQAQVIVFDTTLRDGEQSPGCSMSPGEKLRLARQLDHLGVDVIEAGFPIASEGEFEAVRIIAREVRRPVIAALARTRREDIERAWEALRVAAHPRIHIVIATSDIHLHYKLRMTREQVLEEIGRAVRLARTLADDVEFSAEDATRSDLAFLSQAVGTALAAGATTVNIPDTVGYTTPAEMSGIIQTLRARVPGMEQATLSVHCHNDLGLAVANSLAAVQAGARQVECTVNGIGERAGNASLEELVMALRVRSDVLPFQTGIVTEQIYPTSRLLSEITGVAVQPNKAIVGRNAFAHESGIHQDGVIKHPLTYEIMTPQSVGVPDSRLVLGKHSGRHALAWRCERLGYKFERPELDRLYRRFVALADEIKTVEDPHLQQLIEEHLRETPTVRPAASHATGLIAGPEAP